MLFSKRNLIPRLGKNFFWCIVLLILLPSNSNSQINAPQFKTPFYENISMEQGLPDNFIWCIQKDVTGNLEGWIIDTDGNYLEGVNISLQSESLQGNRGATSNKKGYFQILYLPVGEYTILISSVGYNSLRIEDVKVELGKTTNLGEITLTQKVINLSQVTVSGEKQIIDPESTTYGENIRSSEFENLPVDRNYRNIVTLLPQANTSYFGDEVNIGGATGLENKYLIDGVEVTDPLLGSKGTNLPYNFIKEIQVKSGGYGADSYSALGGLLNVITFSGTNEFHGSFFGFYTSNKFSENQKLGINDVTQGDFSNYDVGFSLGGPLLRNNLWFYTAYNPTFNRRDARVPSFGNSVEKTITHSFAAKLNWLANEQLQFVFTATGDPEISNAVGFDVGVPPDEMTNPDPYFRNIFTGGGNYSLNGKYTIGNNLIIDGMFAYLDREDKTEPSTLIGKTEPLFIDYTNNTWSGGVSDNFDLHRTTLIGKISGTVLLADHILNAGIEYKTTAGNFQSDYNVIQKYDSTFYLQHIENNFGEVKNRIPSFYIEDRWKIFNDLSINAGLRWDGHYIFGTNGKMVQKIAVPLQPRIGFVFLTADDGSQRIYGSFGRYAQEFALIQSGYYHSGNGWISVIGYDQDPRIDTTGGYVFTNNPRTIKPEVEGLTEQYYDDFSLGYEFLFGWNLRAGIQGVYRILREGIDDVYLVDEGRYQYGNPGSGILSAWPKPQRDYASLILSIERRGDEHFNFLASYVLSRNYGNYEGLFSAFNFRAIPNQNATFDDLENSFTNATGLVPNDRTHVFKFAGSYRFSFGLVTGISFVAQSGTPLSDYARTNYGIKFLSPRGSAGRTPAVWDLNARLTYGFKLTGSWFTKLILDIFHIASQRQPVYIDQRHYFPNDENGNPDVLNPTYGQAYRYQPPLSVRIGFEVSY